jgi:hyperosmotically inducible periplasmic protein
MNANAAWIPMSLLAAVALTGCATNHYVSNSQAVADSTITTHVKEALVQDPVTRASNISVNTLDGRVELSGFVNTNHERHEAVRDADSVAGVQSVEDQLRVNAGDAEVGAADSDAVVTQRVRSALADNPETDTAQIKVSTADGVVQLAGFVNSETQRHAAEDTASSVPGVRNVENDIQIASDR